MSDKLKCEDLEVDDSIWVKEFNEYQIIIDIVKVKVKVNKKWYVTFENNKTLIFDNRRRFELM